MPSVRYYIEKRKTERGRLKIHNVPILLFFSFDGKRLQLHTGERVDATEWDQENQRVHAEVPGSKDINKYLKSLGDEVLGIYREARSMGIKPGLSYMRDELKHRRRKKSIDFFDVLMKFIEENSTAWSIHTFRKVRTTYNHLRSFSEAEQITIDLNRIDDDFFERYVRFFRIKYGHSNTTISKNINVLKWFLNWANRRGYHQSMIYRDYKLPYEAKPRLKVSDQVLDWEELMRIQKHEPRSKNLLEVRDIFCFMCFTGLKLSRVYQVKETNVFYDHIVMPSQTQEGNYNFPVNTRAREILERYKEKHSADGNCFPYYHNPYFNQLLKQLGKDSGIRSFVDVEIHSGTEKGMRQVPKYEILTSKIGVNTFLYNGMRLGISSEILAYITDLKTLSGVERFRPAIEGAVQEDIARFDRL